MRTPPVFLTVRWDSPQFPTLVASNASTKQPHVKSSPFVPFNASSFPLKDTLCFTHINISKNNSSALNDPNTYPCLLLHNSSIADLQKDRSQPFPTYVMEVLLPISTTEPPANASEPDTYNLFFSETPVPCPHCEKSHSKYSAPDKLWMWRDCYAFNPFYLSPTPSNLSRWWYGPQPLNLDSLQTPFYQRNPCALRMPATLAGMFLRGPYACLNTIPLSTRHGNLENVTLLVNTTKTSYRVPYLNVGPFNCFPIGQPNVTRYNNYSSFPFYSQPCVLSPFFIISFNISSIKNRTVYCNSPNITRLLSNCWHPNSNWMLVIRIPTYLPMPVNRTSNFPISLSRGKRDFGITAAAVAIIAALAASTIAAGIAISTSVQTAHTLNNLSALTAQALDSQQQINAHLKLAILNLNQQTFLLQEQVDLLWNLQGVSCLPPFNSICVTPWKVKDASKTVETLNNSIREGWSPAFDDYTRNLLHTTRILNETKVPTITGDTFLHSLTSFWSLIRSWGGGGTVAVFLLIGLISLAFLRVLWKRGVSTRKHQILLAQALHNPANEVWVSLIHHQL